MDVTPQTTDRQRIRRHDHGIEQLRAQRHIPTLDRGRHHLGVLFMEQRGADVRQLPVIRVELRTPGEARRQHVSLVIEAITGHAVQNTVGLDRVDMDELVTLTVPQAVFGAL
ncbi:hypothetical protein D3C71_1967700 [compost metagenome]